MRNFFQQKALYDRFNGKYKALPVIPTPAERKAKQITKPVQLPSKLDKA